jgi:hypothetical protein
MVCEPKIFCRPVAASPASTASHALCCFIFPHPAISEAKTVRVGTIPTARQIKILKGTSCRVHSLYPEGCVDACIIPLCLGC